MFSSSRIVELFKRHWSNVLFIIVIATLVFNPDAKAWVLRQLFSIGLFKADFPSGETTSSTSYNLSFKDENGQSFSTSSLKGKIIFINFWATWCPPCRAEMPSINELYKELGKDPRFVFLMVDADDDLQNSKAFMTKNKFDLPVHTSTGPIPSSLYGGTLPTTIILGKDGQLLSKHEGIANYNSENFRKKMIEMASK